MMEVDRFRMHRFTLRFVDTDMEAAFVDEQARKSVRPVRIAIASLTVLMIGYYLLTVHVFQGIVVGFGASNMLRMGLSGMVIFAAFYALTYRAVFHRRQQLIMVVLVLLISTGILRGSARIPFEVLESRGFTGMLAYTFFIYSVFRLRLPYAMAAGWVSAVTFVGYLYGADLIGATAAGRSALLLAGANLGGMLIGHQMEVAARKEFAAMRGLQAERQRSERLLLNILPAPIAERLKASDDAIADHSDAVTVLFADLVGFTPLAASKTPRALVDLLNRIFSEFDALADEHGLEKIKTLGDAYMAVAGLPQPRADHAARSAHMALAMIEATARVAAQTGEPLALRIGLHSGPVVAGVIGRRKFSYDLWGDTVNTASRMESQGLPGAVHCSEVTATLLEQGFRLQARGPMEIKGKGSMNTFLLHGAVASPAADLL